MSQAKTLVELINQKLDGKPPATIAGYTLAATVGGYVAYNLLSPGDLINRTKLGTFAFVRRCLEFEVQRQIKQGTKGIAFPTKGESEEYHNALPEVGLSEERVVEISDSFHEKMDGKLDEKKMSGVVYHGTTMNSRMLNRVVSTHLVSNPIFSTYFGATRKMEAEVSSMMLSMFNAPDDDHCCTYTFGGTESILMCCLAYSNYGKNVLGIETPEIVCCSTVHPAFDKAAMYFGIRLVKTDPCVKTTRAVISEMEKNITMNTVALVGSAPNFHAGTVDDIEGLAKVALKHNIGLHVDACVGGFLLQFMKDAGIRDPKIDFRVKGVTTISADIHKWGGTVKGASVALFNSKELRKHSVFAAGSWQGGLYATQAVSGSKPGYAIAAAWATLLHNGRSRYISSVRDAYAATQKFAKAVEETDGLVQLGVPEVCTVAFTSDKFDIYVLMNRMRDKNYVFNAVQFPAGLHLGLTLEHCKGDTLDNLIRDMKAICAELVEEYRGKKVGDHAALIYGSTQKIPIRSIIDDMMKAYIDCYYRNAPQPKSEI